MAFESGGNVFAVHRAEPYGENGMPWQAGNRVLVSAGLGGAPANGPSNVPAVDGTSRVAPHCVAFVSDATDLALRRTKNRNWKSAVTHANPPGRRQVYVRAIGGTTLIDKALKGLTFLASATPKGRPGNADSHSIAYAVNAERITFASDASNLTSRDRNGVSDIYQRTMSRRYGKKIKGKRVQYLRMETKLVSAADNGMAGSGPSTQPASNVDGSIVAFATTAADLVRTGGVSQIAKADVPRGTGRPKLSLGSSTRGGAPGNGASIAPSLTAAGSWVLFESDATNVGETNARGPDTNGVRDAMLATDPSHERWILGERGATAPTTNPMTGPHGNYVVFERGGQVFLLYVGEK